MKYIFITIIRMLIMGRSGWGYVNSIKSDKKPINWTHLQECAFDCTHDMTT